MAARKATSKRHDYAADTRRIKVVNKENPHREGTGRHAAFEAIRTSKAVADYAPTGNKPKYVEVWRNSGHIEIVWQQTEKPKPAATA